MFKAVISLVIGSNTPLRLTETGEAIQRRLKNVKFEWKGKPDRLLFDKLLAESGAIMGLIIAECGAYLAGIESGGTEFPPCAAIEQHAREHIEAQNLIKQFLSAHPEEAGMGKMSCQPVWESYQGFFKDAEGYFPERRDFNDGMEREGFRLYREPAPGTGKKPIKRDKALPEGLRRGTNRKNQQILAVSSWYGACILLLNYEQFFISQQTSSF
jgi:phage/plasmid-associated DNA primase